MRFKLLLEMLSREINQHMVTTNVPLSTQITFGHKRNEIGHIRQPLLEYTKDSSSLNKALWGSKRGHPITDAGTVNAVNHINNNLRETEPAKEDMSVYSGIRRDPQKMVKDSGGILHHPAFISASIDHEQALKFSVPTPDENIKHVLKIKIRKGQQVGSFIGGKSAFKREQEYLLKSNQVLHIHPDHEDLIDRQGVKVRVHHAIILNPDELNHSHHEVESYRNMMKQFSTQRLANDKFNDDYIKNKLGAAHYSDDMFVEDSRLTQDHLDELSKPENHHIHNKLLAHHTLSSDNISNIMNNSKSVDLSTVATYQKNLTKEHIDTILNHNSNLYNNSLLQNPYNVLHGEHIDKLIQNEDYHPLISTLHKLEPRHIDKLMESKHFQADFINRNLSQRDDLSERQINKLSESKDDSVNAELAKNNNLTHRNITSIIKNTDYGHSDTMECLSKRKDLNEKHIKSIIGVDHTQANNLVVNLSHNYDLKPYMHQILSNDNYMKVSTLNELVHKTIPLDERHEYLDATHVRKNYEQLGITKSQLVDHAIKSNKHSLLRQVLNEPDLPTHDIDKLINVNNSDVNDTLLHKHSLTKEQVKTVLTNHPNYYKTLVHPDNKKHIKELADESLLKECNCVLYKNMLIESFKERNGIMNKDELETVDNIGSKDKDISEYKQDPIKKDKVVDDVELGIGERKKP